PDLIRSLIHRHARNEVLREVESKESEASVFIQGQNAGFRLKSTGALAVSMGASMAADFAFASFIVRDERALRERRQATTGSRLDGLSTSMRGGHEAQRR
ncbi:MAG: hypothetical protein AAF676_18055, partial [Pseudomonadota bacterium]